MRDNKRARSSAGDHETVVPEMVQRLLHRNRGRAKLARQFNPRGKPPAWLQTTGNNPIPENPGNLAVQFERML